MTRRTLAASAWTLLVLVLCLLPRKTIDRAPRFTGHWLWDLYLSVPHKDKIIHALLFGIFAWLWARALGGGRRAWAAIIMGGLVLVAVTELGQSLPWIDRSMDILDALADVVGLGLGLGLAAMAQAAGWLGGFPARPVSGRTDPVSTE
jgi:hypothetical protein